MKNWQNERGLIEIIVRVKVRVRVRVILTVRVRSVEPFVFLTLT